MRLYANPQQRPPTETVLAIGSFDGIHLGHQMLIQTLLERAHRDEVPSVVVTFDPPTRVVFQDVEYLSTLPEKLDILAMYGIDEAVAIPFDRTYAQQSKEKFIEDIRQLRPKAIVVGEDFRFGHHRTGQPKDLLNVTPNVISIPMHTLDGQPIKSTHIRSLLGLGNIDEAAHFLGRPYEAYGVIVRGDQIGRTLGYPTANIATPPKKALPRGVFTVWIWIENTRYLGIANIGLRPTVGGNTLRFEVHILDFSEDVYGAEVRVQFQSRIRPEKKFATLDDLKTQLKVDEQTARASQQ